MEAKFLAKIGKEEILIFILGAILLFGNIGGHSIYILDEARNATCAKEMWQNNQWVIPTYNGELRTDKPILHYYFMKLGYAMFGIGEIGARFFSIIFGSLTLTLGYNRVKKYSGIKTAKWSVFALICSLGFPVQFHLSVPDPYLIFFTSLSLYSLFEILEGNSNFKYILVFYLSCALGILTKGPIALAIPVLVGFIYCILAQKNIIRSILALKPWIGAIIILSISGPWYYLVHQKTEGMWTEGFFLEHNLERFSKTKEGHGGSIFLAPIMALISLFPFGLLAPKAVYCAFKSNDNFVKFNLSVTLVVIGIFMLSKTVLPSYTSPIFLFIALLIAKEVEKNPKYPQIIFAIFALIIGVGFAFSKHFLPEPYNGFGLEILATPLLVGSALCMYNWENRGQIRTYLSMGISFLIFCQLMFYILFPRIDKETAVIKSSQYLDKKTEKIYFHRMNSSFAFYSEKPIKGYEELDKIQAKIDQSNTLYIISRKDFEEQYKKLKNVELVGEFPDLLENFTTVILKKRQNL
ncbi:MAG: hypothetical protein C4K58_00720 [Flavobacteriaceae bacterium]|nr:MAG: hypothetical protein C4K58_00720 [Flavobacteriaceae bacterium]